MNVFTAITCILFAATVDAQDDPVVAFSARLNDSMDNAPGGVVLYTVTSANSGNWYDITTGGFTVPEDNYGIYYMSLSIGVPDYGACATNIHQEGSGRAFTGIKFDNSNVDGIEYASRGFMRELVTSMNKPFEVQNDPGCSLAGLPYRTSSWTMFRYRDISDLSVSFSVARQNDFEFDGTIDWQREFVNDGVDGLPCINSTTGYFQAPVEAFYFFHMSSMSRADSPMQARLVHWPANPPIVNSVCLLNREFGDADGDDTTGRSLMLRMELGDQMSMDNLLFSVLGSSSDGYELSFSGFAYANDTTDPRAIAFCAYMIDWNWILPETLPIDFWSASPINFAGGFVDPPFDLMTGEFTAPRGGTYFVSFSVGIIGTYYGIVGLTDGDLNEVARIDRRNTYHTGIDTLSRDVVVDLYAGNKLMLHAMDGSGLISTQDGKETSFMVMLMRDSPGYK